MGFQVIALLFQVGYLVGQLIHGLLGAVDLLIIIVDGVFHLGDAGSSGHGLHIPAGAGGLLGRGHGGIIAGGSGFQLHAGAGVVDLSQLVAGGNPVPHLHAELGDLTGDHGRDADVLAGRDRADKTPFQSQGALARQSDFHRYILIHGLRFLSAAGAKRGNSEQGGA